MPAVHAAVRRRFGGYHFNLLKPQMNTAINVFHHPQACLNLRELRCINLVAKSNHAIFRLFSIGFVFFEMPLPEPSKENGFHSIHVNLLRQSYQRLTGKDFGPIHLDGVEYAQALYEGDLIVVSHGTEDDPIFNYANQAAQRLFDLPWTNFCQLPSRQSAEPLQQADRQKLLEAVAKQGYQEDYAGIRIASNGRRFWIRGVTIWNVWDTAGIYQGQAAIYSQWETITEPIESSVNVKDL